MSHYENYDATEFDFNAALAKILPDFELYRGYSDVASKLLHAHALGSHWFREVPNTSYDDFTRYVLDKVPWLTADIDEFDEFDELDEWGMVGYRYFWNESLKLVLRSLTTVDLEQILEALGDDCDILYKESFVNFDIQKQAKALTARYQLLMASRSSNDTSSK